MPLVSTLAVFLLQTLYLYQEEDVFIFQGLVQLSVIVEILPKTSPTINEFLPHAFPLQCSQNVRLVLATYCIYIAHQSCQMSVS